MKKYVGKVVSKRILPPYQGIEPIGEFAHRPVIRAERETTTERGREYLADIPP